MRDRSRATAPVPGRKHVGRALRASLLAGNDRITKPVLADVVKQFLPSMQGLEKEIQEIAAILECTDRQFLPAPIAQRVDGDGRGKLQERLTVIRRMIEEL